MERHGPLTQEWGNEQKIPEWLEFKTNRYGGQLADSLASWNVKPIDEKPPSDKGRPAYAMGPRENKGSVSHAASVGDQGRGEISVAGNKGKGGKCDGGQKCLYGEMNRDKSVGTGGSGPMRRSSTWSGGAGRGQGG